MAGRGQGAMLGTIDALIVGLAAFVGGHFLLSSPRLREPLVDALGEERFRGLYALLALAALTWTVLAYGQAHAVAVRSEARRGGKEGVSACKSRVSPAPYKKKK